MQGERVRLAADMAGDDRYGSEFAHGAGVADDNAVQEPPFDVRQRDVTEHLPALGAQCGGRFFFKRALGLHNRDELPRHEREGDEQRGEHDPGEGEHDLHIVRRQPRTEPAVRAEQQNEEEACNDRRYGEWQVNERNEPLLAAEGELGETPCGGYTEYRIQRHDDKRR